MKGNSCTRFFSVALLAALALDPGTRVTFPVKFSGDGEARISTSRSGERFCFATDKANPFRARFWSERPYAGGKASGAIVYGGVSRPSFTWDTLTRAWCAYLEALKKGREVAGRDFEIALELRDGRLRYIVDGRIADDVPATEDVAGMAVSAKAYGGAEIGEARVEKIAASGGRFLPLDVSHRCNAAPLAGVSAPRGGVEIDGVPFEAGAARGGCDNLDLGQSRFMEGLIAGDEPPGHWGEGSFGGRWAEALVESPVRFKFRAPQMPLKAIHLLVANDGGADSVPFANVVFYRPRAGLPAAFRTPDVPADGRLHHIAVPLDAGAMKKFAHLDMLEFELTKGVEHYVGYPDPCWYSTHQAGLPSALRVYAMTLEAAAFDVACEPSRKGALFIEGEVPSWRVKVENRTDAERKVELTLAGTSFDGTASNCVSRTVALRPYGTAEFNFEYSAKGKFGWHYVVLTAVSAGATNSYPRPFVLIRNRERKVRPFDFEGFLFGFWNNRGQHLFPSPEDEIETMARLGVDSSVIPDYFDDPSRAAAMKRTHIRQWWSLPYAHVNPAKWRTDPDGGLAELRRKWESHLHHDLKGARTNVFTMCFVEPGGIFDVATEYFGNDVPEPPTAAQSERFAEFRDNALASLRIAREYQPDVKVFFPWGNPLFCIPFMRENEELRRQIDGVAIDIGYFDRLPEQQLHQASLHRMYVFRREWAKLRDDPPEMMTIEGPCIMGPGKDGWTVREQMDNAVRSTLVLAGYGVHRMVAFAAAGSAGDYWGEQHYGGGAFTALPEYNPRPILAAQGTLIRHLRYLKFESEVATPSTATYAMRFRDVRNGKPMVAAWTVRGRRPARFATGGKPLEVYDLMDNVRRVKAGPGGAAEVVLSPAPVFVYGTDAAEGLELGAPDHSDSRLAPVSRKIADTHRVFAACRVDTDDAYLNSFPDAVRRHPAKMELSEMDGRLAVSLPDGLKGRGLMPFTAALVPERPVEIPGRAKSLAIEVDAHGDWGRLVFVLRDAKGERWYGCGTKGQWNCDDTRGYMTFCHDGARILHMPLPSNAPCDRFRMPGSTWWGAEKGTGDGIADLPLCVEKIFVERRTDVIVLNSPRPASRKPVLLGALYAEYAGEADAGPEAVRLDGIVALPPFGEIAHANPVAEYAAKGTLPAVGIDEVRPPDHERDGTQAFVHFKEVADAAHYEIWVADNEKGDDAIKVADKVKASPCHVRRLVADRDLWAFAVWRAKDGAASRPSAPFKFRLKAEFGEH